MTLEFTSIAILFEEEIADIIDWKDWLEKRSCFVFSLHFTNKDDFLFEYINAALEFELTESMILLLNLVSEWFEKVVINDFCRIGRIIGVEAFILWTVNGVNKDEFDITKEGSLWWMWVEEVNAVCGGCVGLESDCSCWNAVGWIVWRFCRDFFFLLVLEIQNNVIVIDMMIASMKRER